MHKLISKANDLGQQKYAVNADDITETSGVAYTTATMGFKANHGDLAICIETHVEYLYDEVSEKWVRPND